MTLRARCLSAMTDAMVDEAPAMFDDYAAAGLDALLGVLEGWGGWYESPDDENRLWHVGDLTTDEAIVMLKPTTEEARE